MIKLIGRELRECFIDRSLCSFFGIGIYTARKILSELNIKFNIKPSQLSEDNVKKLGNKLLSMKIEYDLRNDIKMNVLMKVKKKIYQGNRHIKLLPVRGQRSSTNARTNRYIGKRY